MMIIGCDFHPSWQQVSWLDTETGETDERKLVHATGDSKTFYQQLAAPALNRDRSDGQQSVVHRTGAGSGARDLDRRCGADPC
jgi:hypothetical protein